jgi:hypothetical protein
LEISPLYQLVFRIAACVIRLQPRPALVLLLWVQSCTETDAMKLAGFLLLLAGWFIAVTAVILLRAAAPRNIFVLAGLAVECVGISLVLRSHLNWRGEKE